MLSCTIVLLLVSVFFQTGCAPHSPQPAPNEQTLPSAVFFLHRVSIPGETLSTIALWRTGDSSNWKFLFTPGSVPTPGFLRLGEVVLIPRDLLQRHEEITREFVAAHTPVKKNVRRPSKHPPGSPPASDSSAVEELIPTNDSAEASEEPVDELGAPLGSNQVPSELQQEFLEKIAP